MAFSDIYIANHHDRLLRLGEPWQARMIAPGTRGEEAVRVGTRRWEELIRQGYRVVNPGNTGGVSKELMVGIRKTIGMILPGGGLINEAWAEKDKARARETVKAKARVKARRKGGSTRNPEEGLTYTTWPAVVLMRERAKEYGERALVGVMPEATASQAWEKAAGVEGRLARAQAGVKRVVLEVFGVVDRPRVYGYAPKGWVEEFGERVRGEEDRERDKAMDKGAAESEKAWGKVVEEYNRVGAKYVGELEGVVGEYEKAAHEAVRAMRAHRLGEGEKEKVAEAEKAWGKVAARAGVGNAGVLGKLGRAVKVFTRTVMETPVVEGERGRR